MKFLMKWIIIIGLIIGMASIYFAIAKPTYAGGTVTSETSAQSVQVGLSNSIEEQIRSIEEYLAQKVTKSYKSEMKAGQSVIEIERVRYESISRKESERILEKLKFTKEIVDSGKISHENIILHDREVIVGYARNRITRRMDYVWRKISDF